MIKLKSKAKNLSILKKIFFKRDINIPKFFYFKLIEYKKNKQFFIDKIKKFQKETDIIVRSSAANEDGSLETKAGQYDSLILKKNQVSRTNIEIAKFVKQFKFSKDEIIIQKLIKNVDYAGVVFTRDSKYNSPYYLINYDTSGKTNLVTSGARNESKRQLVIYKNFRKKHKFYKLVNVCKILEKQFTTDRLDIEFAVKKKKIYLFQVRYLPYRLLVKSSSTSKNEFDNVTFNIEKKLNYLLKQNLNLSGTFTLFSNMTDWNPAEMIGDKPNPLALSLYKELITDEVWREQRKNYGYKDVYPNVLMFSFAGSPYIDVRTDLNSFLPSKLNKVLSKKILEKYLLKLKKNLFLHDKIEFNLVETCYSLCSSERLIKLFDKKTVNIYLRELKKLTIHVFKNNFVKIERNKIDLLENKLNEIDKKKISPIQKIFFFVNIIKDYGTLPFAGIARMAFISQIILQDLKKKNLISKSEFENFFNSLQLINSEISEDYKKLLKNKNFKKKFIKKYGHIRPSTYDINSLSYKENYNNYFSNKKINVSKSRIKKIYFKNKKKLNQIFLQKYKISFNYFLNYAKKNIKNREYAKFLFSKGIDKIFENLLKLSKEINIKRSDLCYLDVKNILNFYPKLESRKLKKAFVQEIIENKKEFNFTKMIKLPDVIKSKKDVYFFEENIFKINFITTRKIIANFVDISQKNIKKNLDGKIVLIKSADPGYDYIFNHNVKGLVTMYGGSNSHMAIRCLELNIPAAIGIGKIKYESILKSNKLLLDCLKEKLYVIK